MNPKRVLVLGAGGFIGRHLVARLLAAGHFVTCAGRSPSALRHRFPTCTVRQADLTRDSAEAWTSRLEGIDAVVNAAGAMTGELDKLHASGAVALFDACDRVGVPVVLQISALGAGAQPERRFLATKAVADAHLLHLVADRRPGWRVIRPSLVIGRGGASTTLFCALAALPFPVVLGPGNWTVQPVHIDDLSTILLDLLDEAPAPAIIDVAGPEAMTTDALTAALRVWLGLPNPRRRLRLPTALLRLGAVINDALPGFTRGGARLTRESLAMLMAGNVAGTRAPLVVARTRSLADALAAAPSEPGDLLQARLTPLRGLLAISLALIWIGSGVVSWLVPAARDEALLAGLHLSAGAALSVTRMGAALDIVLGAGLAWRRARNCVLSLQIVVIVAYTALATVLLPDLWRDPFGPLLKNLAVIAASLVLRVLEV